MGKEQVDTDHGKQTTNNIIIVKKGGHGEHGGAHGAWKVAYADFVTAMMAFFLVMWLLASDAKVKESVQAYFQDPLGFNEKVQAGLLVGTGISVIPGPGEPVEISQESLLEVQKKLMEQAAEDLRDTLRSLPGFEDLEQSIDIEVTAEGLLVELIDGDEGNFFEVGSSRLNYKTIKILQAISEQFGKFSNRVRIMGHTDARGYSSRNGYSNWELSADRANAARRIMEPPAGKLGYGQILNVAGFADQQLKNKNNPYDVTNRRISILLMNKEQLVQDTVFLKSKNY